MTESELTTRDRDLSLLKEFVHSELDYSQYDSTIVRNCTNCYSHALGSTLTCSEFYRIGAICGKKSRKQEYFSIDEIVDLLHKDLDFLGLSIQKSFLGDTMKPNQYQIALFVKIYADHRIHDFHFYRNDCFGWSEKWWGYKPTMFDEYKPLNYFPWHFIDVFMITK